jgi:hypothetical protein
MHDAGARCWMDWIERGLGRHARACHALSIAVREFGCRKGWGSRVVFVLWVVGKVSLAGARQHALACLLDDSLQVQRIVPSVSVVQGIALGGSCGIHTVVV